MENLSTSIQQPLEFLIYSTIIMFIIITVFLVKLLADLSSLTKSLQSLTSAVRHELEPTLKEFQRALKNINSLANGADKQVNNLNKSLNLGIDVLSSSTVDILGKAKILTSALKQGLLIGLKVFRGK